MHHRLFQRSSSFTMGPPTAAMMPPPLLLQDVKGKPKADSSDQQHVMGSLDAALHRMAQRRQSECASDQKSVQSMIELRRAPRVLSQSLTLPKSQDDLEHRRTKSNDVNLFTIKWNSRSTINRRESIEFEGDFDEIDWDSDADDTSESHQLSRTLSALEQAPSFRSLSWNPCDDDDVSQSSMMSSSSTVSKSRGRRPRLIRSGSITSSSSKAMKYMQQRSCLQQSLLRAKKKKPKRRHSSDEVSLSLVQRDGQEPMQRQLSRKKSNRSKEETNAKSHTFKSAAQDCEKSSRSSTTRSTKHSQHGSNCSSKNTMTDKKEQSKLHSRLQGCVENVSRMSQESLTNKERTAAKTAGAVRSSKPVQHRRSSRLADPYDIRMSMSKKKETGQLDPISQQNVRKSASQQRASAKCSTSRKITDILAVPNLINGGDSPRKSARRSVVVCTKSRL
ncbi:hypothetical protein FisN_11Hh321 [Fistulifera solaris]|jgi:hypothetical protein|uniref:Uncharacterized protein n=1 Tax=Fistulifera solaris TaxID=1519565 RepID=A0A1Z5JGJ6_FISSO|nr:hypothetical protein FisN_11Hh321 [Fistulifera solaris]|eukprot:GAX12881.1 hypothetical protein FisN_11Hh321 [Fistulifera solaris]